MKQVAIEMARKAPEAVERRWELVVACSAWADACSRGMFMPSDRLIGTVVDDPRISHLLVANPYRSRPVRATRRLLGQGEPPLPPGPGVRVQLTPVRLRRHDPVSLPGIVRACERYDTTLRQACDRLGMDQPAVVVGNPLVAAFAPLEWAKSVTFYAWDDWASYPAHRRWWPAYEQAYDRIRARGCRVAAVSQVLLDRLAPVSPSLLIPNGIAPEEWLSPGPTPEWFNALPEPRLLYVGTLDERLDQDVIRSLSSLVPDGSVVLVGKELDDAMAPLRSLPNVHVLPPVSRGEIAAAVHSANVCILPHQRTPLTEAMSPLKLYEYVAGGRPVVATDLPPVRDVSPRVVRVSNDAFADAVAEALRSPALPEEERRAFVSENSWSSRFESLFTLIWADGRRAN